MIQLLELLRQFGPSLNSDDLTRLLVQILDEEGPSLDQDIRDLLTETYIFVAHGFDPIAYPDGLKEWEDLDRRIEQLTKSSQ